ncbi:MAG: non-ribosomal peptide synthetase [Candidatus Binatia bacterium]
MIGSKLTDRMASLSPAKRALLEKRLRERGVESLPVQTIPRRAEREFAPLSFAQQRLWFLNQLEPESSAYNEGSVLRLTGQLDLDSLHRAVNHVVERHEVLRTNFVMVDGNPMQRIAHHRTVEIPCVDLRSYAGEKRDARVEELIGVTGRRPFDLTRDLMLRPLLIRVADREHILMLVKHHIASDGWSSGIFRRELASCYEAFAKGEIPALPELPIQYADYAVWQRKWLQGEALESHLSYWKQQLSGVPVLKLPTDHPRPAVQTYRGAKHSFALSPALTDRLKTLSREKGVTLFMTLLAALQALLYRYTGQHDFSVGSPIAGRTRPETEGLIGFFVNTLVLRADLSGDPTFGELLARVRKAALEAYDHQELPFEKLVQEINPDRTLGQTPLFQVMFAYQNLPHRNTKIPGLTVAPVDRENHIAKFDLYARFSDGPDGLLGSIEYNTDIYEPGTIARIAEHLTVLLEGLVADPERRLSDLAILTDGEKRRLLIDWNDTERDYPRNKTVHELFEAQAERTPDAVAAVLGDAQLTYGELNRRSNRLAHYLRKLGVGPDVMVGICIERSLETIVGLLAILKAGGAYVPLDPSYPEERLAFMLEDIQATVLLTEQKLLQHFPACSPRVVCLDRDGEEIARQPHENLEDRTTPDNLAYVIYTSGSTGKPKGVEIPHRAITRLLFGVDYVRLDASQTFLHLAPISFDASTFEIWGALLHGAKCVLPAQRLPSPAELGCLLHQHKVSILWLTASLFNVVVDEAPEALSEVRQLLIGGEALSVPHVRRALSLLPSTQIINGYGPTESATFTCCYPIPAELDETTISIPIGRPIGNTQVYILDSHLNPAPTGAPGELYIGGDGLARGYLARPELTNERFIPNPFSREPGQRLYKTGDLARYLADGNIEFLGRLDNQVKIRGFRIELGEIESVIAQHPVVREAVVVARDDAPGEKRLAAYVVPKRESPPTTDYLRRFLQEKLPHYMIPSAFVHLESLPLTPNGKVDYRALPDPRNPDSRDRREYIVPRDETERILCRVWSEVLGIDRVGLDDDFFASGGHSLLAAKLFTRLDEAFGRSLPLGVLFNAPTVRLLAERYRCAPEPKARSARIPLWTAGTLPPIFGVPGVFGNVICFAELSRELGSDQPFYGLQSIGLDGAHAPLDSVEEMATLYVGEIRSVQPQGPYAIVGACFGATVAYEMARRLLAAGEEVAFLGLLDPTRREGKSASGGPALTMRILKRGAAFGSFLSNRVRLYREEMRPLGATERVKHLASKLRLLGGLIGNYNALKGTERELNQIEVYRANLLALDRYRRKPLEGCLRSLAILATKRRTRSRAEEQLDWSVFWKGNIMHHLVPGKDSGDMLRGKNAGILAVILRERLKAAFAESLEHAPPLRRHGT